MLTMGSLRLKRTVARASRCTFRAQVPGVRLRREKFKW